MRSLNILSNALLANSNLCGKRRRGQEYSGCPDILMKYRVGCFLEPVFLIG